MNTHAFPDVTPYQPQTIQVPEGLEPQQIAEFIERAENVEIGNCSVMRPQDRDSYFQQRSTPPETTKSTNL